MKKLFMLTLCVSSLTSYAMNPNQEEPIAPEVHVPQSSSASYNPIISAPEVIEPESRGGTAEDATWRRRAEEVTEKKIKGNILATEIQYEMLKNRKQLLEDVLKIEQAELDKLLLQHTGSVREKLAYKFNKGALDSVEAIPLIVVQAMAQAAASEFAGFTITKIKELFDPEVRNNKEFIEIFNKLKSETKKLEMILSIIIQNHERYQEELKNNPEDAVLIKMVNKTLEQKNRLVKKHNQLIEKYTNQLIEIECKERAAISPQTKAAMTKVAIGGVATAAVVAGITYLRR